MDKMMGRQVGEMMGQVANKMVGQVTHQLMGGMGGGDGIVGTS
jgi:hypothetical protein